MSRQYATGLDPYIFLTTTMDTVEKHATNGNLKYAMYDNQSAIKAKAVDFQCGIPYIMKDCDVSTALQCVFSTCDCNTAYRYIVLQPTEIQSFIDNFPKNYSYRIKVLD